MTYPESLAWLYASRPVGIKLGLEATRRLLEAVGNPQDTLRFLHVAGTNGKGSVCAMMDSICRASGLRTGLYTSPHLVTFAERIQIDGVPISRHAICAGLERLRRLTARWDPAPTFFELTTALALDHFARENAGIVVLETGLGGRLDSTNVVNPLVTIFTPIDLDHQQYLGDSLAEIAGEKAGILKPGVPAVSSPQTEIARRVLTRSAAEKDTQVDFVETPLERFPVNLAGSHQKLHAALAEAALAAAGVPIPTEALQAGLATVQWPGRFQKLPGGLILDGAHNPAAAALLARTWREAFGPSIQASLVLGVLADKDSEGIVRALAPIASSVVATPVANERSLPASDLASKFRALAPPLPVRTALSLSEALEMAGPPPILVAGSLFLVGEALALQGQIIPDPAV